MLKAEKRSYCTKILPLTSSITILPTSGANKIVIFRKGICNFSEKNIVSMIFESEKFDVRAQGKTQQLFGIELIKM